jgi:nucleoside-diphosphate-sugar epimerase
MKVFLTGATGAIGRPLTRQLVEAGHTVHATTTTEAKVAQLWNVGAHPIVLDLLDPDAVARAVAEAEPDVVVHQATALGSAKFDMRRFDRTFAMTNRLRTEGTDHLLAAARAVGARRFVAQSFAGWPLAREGGPVKDETAPFDPSPPAPMRQGFAAIKHLEEATLAYAGEGVVLRYGGFYGPGTSLSGEPGSEFPDVIRKRRLPIVGEGTGVWSFIHVEDAATATVRAIEHGEAGIYHVVDDEPARPTEWIPVLADALGAPPPRHVPRWLGRIAGGEVAVAMMTTVRGASNAKARRELGWEPRYPSWRKGFVEALS